MPRKAPTQQSTKNVKKSKTPLVSVVVLSWNTLEETTECLENLRELDYPNYELIIVDNGSNDGSKEYLAKQNDIVYIDLPVNTGFTGGQLAAYEKANGDYLALVNSDAVVAKNWLRVLVDLSESDEKIAVTGGRAHVWNEQFDAYDETSPFYSYQRIDKYYGYAETLTYGLDEMDVHSISGAALLIKTAALRDIGYFYDVFFAYYEETDLIARLLRAGYRAVYTPEAAVWHQIAASSSGGQSSDFYLYQMSRNRFLFAYRNFDPKYLKPFLWNYSKSFIKALAHYFRRNRAERMMLKAFVWNLNNIFKTHKTRKEIMKLGDTYSEKLYDYPMPKDVTIIIPNYNYAQYVSEAIESALAQTIAPTKIIVIDDGSTDNSLEVLDKYKDKITLVKKKNSGVVFTKNKGITLSRTFWTVFLDADDVLEPDFLEKKLKLASKGPFDVVYSDMQYFGAKDKYFKSREYKLSALLDVNFVHNSALIKTSLLKESGGYKEEMSEGYEDWELYVTLSELGARFGYLPQALLRYRQHDAALSRNADAEMRAKRLSAKVRELHPALYQNQLSIGRSLKLLRNFGMSLLKNPEILFIVIVSIPKAIYKAILGGLFGFLKSMSNSLHTYLHNKHDK